MVYTKKTKEEFQVSEYIVRQARKLASAKGIFELPDQERGKAVTEEVKNYITSFYSDDELSRQMPGKEGFVSMGKKVHMQKRLLLCDLKELYSAGFTNQWPWPYGPMTLWSFFLVCLVTNTLGVSSTVYS